MKVYDCDNPDHFKALEQLEEEKELVKNNFVVLPYCNDDPIVCKKLEDIGCAAIMPLAAPIGTGMGIQNDYNLRIIVENAKIPVIVDAGVGTASDATIAMELGCDGVLVNTAIAKAKKPFEMALAFKNAVIAGRQSFKSGRIDKILMGNPSSPSKGII